MLVSGRPLRVRDLRTYLWTIEKRYSTLACLILSSTVNNRDWSGHKPLFRWLDAVSKCHGRDGCRNGDSEVSTTVGNNCKADLIDLRPSVKGPGTTFIMIRGRDVLSSQLFRGNSFHTLHARWKPSSL
ncbi:unnamed protein product [Taenia asiatica]|uniref:Uncharacterized protein n=1 Tax=Taenia asiatica TaxID=60517 RepID=A0A0R3W8D7_TAEAS|nr:unnamed protein product [Taenia asiatica]